MLAFPPASSSLGILDGSVTVPHNQVAPVSSVYGVSGCGGVTSRGVKDSIVLPVGEVEDQTSQSLKLGSLKPV